MADTSATSNNLPRLDETDVSSSTPLGWRLLRTLAIGGVFGGLFLFLSLRSVPFDRVTDALRLADWTLIGASVACYFAYLVIKAWRWSVQLRLRTDSRPFGVLFRLVTIGTAANAMIPHSGEIVRSYAARGDLKLSATSILGSIAAERFYDFAMVLLLAGIAFAVHPAVPQQLSNAMVTLFAFGAVLALRTAGHCPAQAQHSRHYQFFWSASCRPDWPSSCAIRPRSYRPASRVPCAARFLFRSSYSPSLSGS